MTSADGARLLSENVLRHATKADGIECVGNCSHSDRNSGRDERWSSDTGPGVDVDVEVDELLSVLTGGGTLTFAEGVPWNFDPAYWSDRTPETERAGLSSGGCASSTSPELTRLPVAQSTAWARRRVCPALRLPARSAFPPAAPHKEISGVFDALVDR
jgi:hypothetical protein